MHLLNELHCFFRPVLPCCKQGSDWSEPPLTVLRSILAVCGANVLSLRPEKKSASKLLDQLTARHAGEGERTVTPSN